MRFDGRLEADPGVRLGHWLLAHYFLVCSFHRLVAIGCTFQFELFAMQKCVCRVLMQLRVTECREKGLEVGVREADDSTRSCGALESLACHPYRDLGRTDKCIPLTLSPPLVH